jgi:glutamate/tyrosine decarboxylase-like PLP-dependent enzyme
MYNQLVFNILDKALSKLSEGFATLPPTHPTLDMAAMESILLKVAEKMQDNYPYFHPLYAGQMLKPPHEIARLAYMLAMWVNPNNHALDGGRASSAMEKEAVAQIAKMFDWTVHLGHLTSGGTFANLEALWVAGQLAPQKMIVASDLAHYTHERISQVLGLKFKKIATDKSGKMDLVALEKALKTGKIGTVVVTLGTTGIGSTDDLQGIINLKNQYLFRIHIDAAYGGYFRLAQNLAPNTLKSFAYMQEADSIVIDPHKHGLQPYGCGCILFKNPEVGRFYKHHSPYTYFSSDELHLGEISLECSRAGAAAVGLWATMQLLPLEKEGVFSQDLEKSHQAALLLHQKIGNSAEFIPLLEPELDIVCWAVKGASISEINVKTKKLFDIAAKQNLHLALLNYPTQKLPNHWKSVKKDADFVVCLRSCLMKAEHLDWVDRIWTLLLEAHQVFN